MGNRSALAKPKTYQILREAIARLDKLVPTELPTDVIQAADNLEKFATTGYPIVTALLRMSDMSYGGHDVASLTKELLATSAKWVTTLSLFSGRVPHFTHDRDRILFGYYHVNQPPPGKIDLTQWNATWGITNQRPSKYSFTTERIATWYPDVLHSFCQMFGSPFTKRSSKGRGSSAREIIFSTLSLDYR
jgi:hypothetical protein